jgi:replicative DNA helicase
LNHTLLPPQNIDVEERILASCLLYKSDIEIASEIAAPEDFYRTAHQKIFSAMIGMMNQGQQVDTVTVAEHLKKSNQLDKVGGIVYLAKLTDEAPVVPNMAQYCGILRNLSIKRQLMIGCQEVFNQCQDNSISSVEVLDHAQKVIAASENKTTTEAPVMAGELVDGLLRKYQIVNQSKTGITGLATKFRKFDAITGGLQDTDLIIVAGRPGMGKTAWALDVAKAVSEDEQPVLFVSLEMGKEQIVSRMVSKASGVNGVKLRAGGINEKEWKNIMGGAEAISDMVLYVDAPRDSDFDQIRRKIRRAKRDFKIKLVIIDYLTLMTRRGDFTGRNDLKIGSITRDLKQMAGDLNIPVVLLSQLNRIVESRGDKRPVLSDLRESGNIEQDADMVLFLYRDEVYNKDENNPLKGTGELIIAKNRHGPTGFIKMAWDETTATYRNFIDDQNYQNWQDHH